MRRSSARSRRTSRRGAGRQVIEDGGLWGGGEKRRFDGERQEEMSVKKGESGDSRLSVDSGSRRTAWGRACIGRHGCLLGTYNG